ncbi:MAG: LysE family translocator [Desulfobacterales bacterium]|nr:LysE family translocator [Desulfobacterales bacterium]
MLSTEFLLTSLVVVLVPGTGVIYTVSTGLFSGWKNAVAAAVGCTAGILPHLLACVLGLSAILHMSAVLFSLLKFAGAAYLLYLAWSMWQSTGLLQADRSTNKNGFLKIGVRGFLINILNPKLSVFFLAFIPLFVSPDAGAPIRQMVMLSAVFMLMTFVVFVCYGLLSGMVSRYILHSPKIMKRIQQSFALVFAALATRLAFTER